MDVLAAANAMAARGVDVVSLAVGQPSAPAPRTVREAAARATLHGRLQYTDALGRVELRRRIARHYGEAHGLDVDERRIAVTTGSSAGFALAFLALFDVGDRIAIERPGYPAYRNIMRALGLQPVEVASLTGETLRELHAEAALSGALVASPGNPTGTVIAPARLSDIAETTRDLGIALVSDEIYHRLVFGEVTAETMLAHRSDAVVINSFSKFYCMTGWRIGWMVLPPSLVRPVERIAQSLYISAPDASQVGATEAFDATEELVAVRDGYAANRVLLLEALPKLGFDLAARADGAFYAWADTTTLADDAEALSRRMLAEAHVAAPAGHDFDPPNGGSRMRFSYAASRDEVGEAIDRLGRWLG